MHNFARKDAVEEISLKIKDMEEQLELRAKTDNVDQQFDTLKTDIDARIAILATKEDLDYDLKRQDFSLQKHIKKVREEIKSLKELEGKIAEFALKLNHYSLKSEINDKVKQVWKHFDKYCSFDHIINFKAEMEPRMQRCESLVGDFKLEIINNQKIIRRFDEVLLEKASKFSIEQIYQKLSDYMLVSDFEVYKQDCK